ncbi:MAG: hypothetical protein LQ346_004585 [Caloplaca aetnensis]|nr:MAG: hypothetical protein LQ346_004585 [Caloplaca aetnensis]
MLHEDLRTNLTAFSSWFHTYLISPHRALSKQGAKRLTQLVARRKADVAYEDNNLTDEMRHVVSLWEQEPIQVGSTEWRRARIRVIRDMYLAGALDEEIQNGLVLSELEQGEVPQSYWRGPIDKQLNACRPGPAAPRLKELNWGGTKKLHDPRAQTLVNTCVDEPTWKVNFRIHREQAKAKNQVKLAARMETKKSKGKAKKEAHKLRKQKMLQGGDEEFDEGSVGGLEMAGRSPSAAPSTAEDVGRAEINEGTRLIEGVTAVIAHDALDEGELSGEEEVRNDEKDLGLSSEESEDEDATPTVVDDDGFRSDDNQDLAQTPRHQHDYEDTYDDHSVGFVGGRYYNANEGSGN